jgi:hypothetical protein
VGMYANQLVAGMAVCRDVNLSNTIVVRMPFYYNRNGRTWDAARAIVESWMTATADKKLQYGYPVADLLVAEDVFFEIESPPEPGGLEELVIWYDEEDAQVFPAGAVTLVKNTAQGDYETTTHLGELAFAPQEGDAENSYNHSWQFEIPDEMVSDNFTIEFWARAAIVSPPLGSVGSSGVLVQSDNGFGLNMSHSAQWDDFENPGTPEENNQIDFRLIQDTNSGSTFNRARVYESFGSSVQGWKHACFQRINGQNVFHYDGGPLALIQTDGTMPTPGIIPLNAVFSFSAFNAEPFTNSAIGQIRISNSALYGTGTFTPPTEAFYVPTP